MWYFSWALSRIPTRFRSGDFPSLLWFLSLFPPDLSSESYPKSPLSNELHRSASLCIESHLLLLILKLAPTTFTGCSSAEEVGNCRSCSTHDAGGPQSLHPSSHLFSRLQSQLCSATPSWEPYHTFGHLCHPPPNLCHFSDMLSEMTTADSVQDTGTPGVYTAA